MFIKTVIGKEKTKFMTEVEANLPEPIVKVYTDTSLQLTLTLQESQQLERLLASANEDIMRQIDENDQRNA